MTINKKFVDLFINVSSRAALASFYLVGKKDKIAADKAAVDSIPADKGIYVLQSGCFKIASVISADDFNMAFSVLDTCTCKGSLLISVNPPVHSLLPCHEVVPFVSTV